MPLVFCYHTHSHNTYTQRGKRINIIQYALQSQTPCNLSALDFKVWVFAYFALDCCHFVIFVPFSFKSQEKNNLKGPRTNSPHRMAPVRAAFGYGELGMKVHTGQRSHPVIQLITASDSGSFEHPSVANLPLIKLANYQAQTQKKHFNLSQFLPLLR